ncbi:MAG: putative 2OG-Fe(II) oxygenase [Leptothrix sp. (in: b-proteobacteria)]
MQLANLFSTPIASFDHGDLRETNRQLAEILIADSTQKPSLTVSNIGNWHSNHDLHERQEPCFQKLVGLIRDNTWKVTEALAARNGKTYPRHPPTLNMWAMVMKNGDYTKPHSHSNVNWAVVYYPDIGESNLPEAPLSGGISFVDPRTSLNLVPGLDTETGEFHVQPKAGQMLVFPGWLIHYVHPYRGNRPRVSIACNVSY